MIRLIIVNYTLLIISLIGVASPCLRFNLEYFYSLAKYATKTSRQNEFCFFVRTLYPESCKQL